MYLNDDPPRHIATISKVLTWLGFLVSGLIATLICLQAATAHAATTPINAVVCSGGNHVPQVISVAPASGTTLNTATPTLNLTVDWVDSLTITRGGSTLATVTGHNQANEHLTASITLLEGTNHLTFTTTGGCPQATTTETYQLTYVPNAATVKPVTTNTRSPRLFGHYTPFGVRVFVVVAGRTYQATAYPDLTWELPAGVITPDLLDGPQDVRVYTMNASDDIVYDEVYPNAIIVDSTPPAITITTQSTLETRSPKIAGTVDDATATITVTINGDTYTAINNRDGTWYLAAGTIAKLSNGTYPVTVAAVDPAGNTAHLTTSFQIVAAHQAGFILAPNTGYLRIGTTNIPSRYLYAAGFLLLVGLLIALVMWRRRATTTKA